MKSILGIILILAGAALAYYGVITIQENSASVEFLNIEIDASDTSGVEQGYLYIGLAIVLFGGGIFTLNKK